MFLYNSINKSMSWQIMLLTTSYNHVKIRWITFIIFGHYKSASHFVNVCKPFLIPFANSNMSF